MNPIVSTLIKGMLYFILKAKQGGKYLSRKEIINRKTGKKSYQYKYKPMQQRAAHEVTRGKFEKVTKLSGDEHKNQIEHALQNGIHVSLHVLRDYPDLTVKYHQQARLAKADKIREKVKASKAELSKPSIKQIKESSQVPNPSAENKGREEKKMTLDEATKRNIQLIKQAENYIKLQSEGHETYKLGITDTPYDSEIREMNSIIREGENAKFLGKWSKDYTDKKMNEWNSAIKAGKGKTPKELSKIIGENGSDLIRAINYYKEMKSKN